MLTRCTEYTYTRFVHSVHLSEIKLRIFELGIRQEQVADEAGYESTLFSRYLNGRRPPPADFREKVNAALDKLEAAEKAGREARERVLREGAA